MTGFKCAQWGRAVVVGGSVAGLLAARVLSERFERVTIVERDELPERPGPRDGAPQARHFHALLAGGRRTLERFFPGITDELARAGAPLADMAGDVNWFTPAGWGVRFESDLTMICSSRDLLEWTIRRRVLALENVEVVSGRDVVGLLATEGATAITGVSVRARRICFAEPRDEALEADLVVDASGRGSHAPDWLEALGLEPPRKTIINSHLGYASRFYEIPDGYDPGWTGIYVQAAPPEKTRGGVLFPVEGGRWHVSLIGMGGDHPPTDEIGFLEFARSLRAPDIYEALKAAKPLSPIHGFRNTPNRVRHFERLRRAPERFLVLGDAACAFNPVYGQGMSAAAAGARVLEQCLDEQRRRRSDASLDGLARRFQRALTVVNSDLWTIATGEDARVRGATGGTAGFSTRVMHAYLDTVVELSTGDRRVRESLLRVFSLIDRPASLVRPSIVARVAARAIRSGVVRLWQAVRFGARASGPEVRPLGSGDVRTEQGEW